MPAPRNRLTSLAVLVTAVALLITAAELRSRGLPSAPQAPLLMQQDVEATNTAGTDTSAAASAVVEAERLDPGAESSPGCLARGDCLPLGAGVAELPLEGRCVPPPWLPPGAQQRETVGDRRVLGMPARCHLTRQQGALCAVRCNVEPELDPRLLGPAREARLAEATEQLLQRLRERFGPEQSAQQITQQNHLRRSWQWRAAGEQLNLEAWQRLAALEADSLRDRQMAPRLSLTYSAP